MTKRKLNTTLLAILFFGTIGAAAGGFFLHRFMVTRSAQSLKERAQKAKEEAATLEREKERKKLEEALEYYERYLAYKPQDFDTMAAYGLLVDTFGLTFDQSQETQQIRFRAVPIFEKVLVQLPEGETSQKVREALVTLIIDIAKTPEEFNVADPHIERLIKDTQLDPSKPDQYRPDKHAKFLLQRGKIYEGEKLYEQAVDAYIEAIKLDPTLVDAYKASAVIVRRQFDGAKAADALMDVAPAESKGASDGKDKQSPAADAPKLAAETAKPADAKSADTKADAAGKLAQIKQGLIAANPTDASAYLARAEYRWEFKLPGARGDLAQALKYDRAFFPGTHTPKVLLTAAIAEMELLHDGADVEKARRWLKEAIFYYPRRKDMYLARYRLEMDAGKPKDAAKVLEGAHAALPESNDLTWYLANAYIDNNDLKPARELIESFRQAGFPTPLVNLLDARVLVAQNRWDGARLALEQVRPSLERAAFGMLPAIQADMALGICYRRLGRNEQDLDQEIAAYRRVLAIDPNYALASVELASAMLRRDPTKASEAMQSLQKLAAGSPDAQLRLKFAEILRQPPGARDWSAVERELDAIENNKEDTNKLRTLVWRAEIDLQKGEPDAALKRVHAARVEHPDRIDLWLAEAQINLHEKIDRPADMLALLDEAERKFGVGKPELFMARLRFLAGRGAQGRAGLVTLISRLKEIPADNHDELAELLARALASAGANKEALDVIEAVTRNHPDHLGVRTILFELALRELEEAKDPAAAKQAEARVATAVEDLRRLGPNEVEWRVAEAARIVVVAGRTRDLKRLDEAKRLLDEVRRERPNWARLSVLEADIARLEKKPERAIEALNRAIDQGDRNVAIIRQLVQLYYDERRYAEADAVIRKIPGRGQLGNDLKRLATDVSVGLGDREQAMRMAREAVPPDSTNYKDHIWLGQVYTAVGEIKPGGDAELAFEKAIKLAPQRSEPWLALVQFDLRTNRRADAEAVLERARAALPADIAALTLANGYRIVGRNDLAEQLFEKAIAANPNDSTAVRTAAAYFLDRGRLDRAEPLLQGQIQSSVLSDRLWGRRVLALGLLDSRRGERLPEALNLIGKNAEEKDITVDDRRDDEHARALILTAFPERRDEAIKLLEGLEQDLGRLPAGDRFILAQLYETKDETWPKARDMFQELVAAYPNTARFVQGYLRALVRRKEFDEANQWLAHLEQLGGYNPMQTLTLKVAMLKAQGQTDEAARQVRAFAEADPKEVVNAAMLLEQLGDTAAAEGLFKRWAAQKDQPGNVLALAAFYGRQNRPQEAIDLCDEARRTSIPLETVLGTAFGALGISQPNPDLLRRIEGWIDEAERQAGQKDKYHNQRGLLWTLAGRHKDAEALYRKAIAADSADILALNNLAWLLALTGGNADEALTFIDRAIAALGYYNDSLLDTRAVVQLSRHRPQEAVTDLKRALQNRRDATIYFHLARALHAAGDVKAAAEALKTAETQGLKSSEIDPLERTIYNDLVAELHAVSTPAPTGVDVDVKTKDEG